MADQLTIDAADFMAIIGGEGDKYDPERSGNFYEVFSAFHEDDEWEQIEGDLETIFMSLDIPDVTKGGKEAGGGRKKRGTKQYKQKGNDVSLNFEEFKTGMRNVKFVSGGAEQTGDAREAVLAKFFDDLGGNDKEDTTADGVVTKPGIDAMEFQHLCINMSAYHCKKTICDAINQVIKTMKVK
eukprot:CAMPEP_0181315954 /NCGR_PEP_ID=MMETSP1101-20121128/15642_1 /TAXON_ID=46948 /ORGANISM="Rhodomonas abbreviata, Strain Caron Lab Isolate" /LENGTH=182 /DNA_ID=CAMNT_0023423179 /DNA_START=26 /DNA_END=574 /DNA_ORIENTATION=-